MAVPVASLGARPEAQQPRELGAARGSVVGGFTSGLHLSHPLYTATDTGLHATVGPPYQWVVGLPFSVRGGVDRAQCPARATAPCACPCDLACCFGRVAPR
ncbi:hypothetical protein GUJ93_ZPchr0585g33752 [Zizania palustris]|uniref:Uncharacterized protein n=1 Tax=Zizania palustris TaxID=103762 RepID=A0A8J5RB40_ZIZPA|nr:hypothetical protein GUJ93_ZPchr0585g33752 [Zizania palustris]